MNDQHVGPGVHTVRHAIALLEYFAEDMTDEPEILEQLQQARECAAELKLLDAALTVEPSTSLLIAKLGALELEFLANAGGDEESPLFTAAEKLHDLITESAVQPSSHSTLADPNPNWFAPATCERCGCEVFWNALKHTVNLRNGRVVILECHAPSSQVRTQP